MGNIVTKTLAENYLQQGYLKEAYEMFKVLSEKDPSDTGIRNRLRELEQMLTTSPPVLSPSDLSSDEKISLLKRWLSNIQKRRGE